MNSRCLLVLALASFGASAVPLASTAGVGFNTVNGATVSESVVTPFHRTDAVSTPCGQSVVRTTSVPVMPFAGNGFLGTSAGVYPGVIGSGLVGTGAGVWNNGIAGGLIGTGAGVWNNGIAGGLVGTGAGVYPGFVGVGAPGIVAGGLTGTAGGVFSGLGGVTGAGLLGSGFGAYQ